ncbi:hypothetical protein [uncultured Sphingomonas sp.]|uniref:hypothetical protein n=1 Tax=uncultured Sphingomonas sp. TaxID=158754 RepID=UPI0035CA4429
MIALLLALQVAAAANGVTVGAIPKQQLPATGCAAFLWSSGEKRILVAMAVADPAAVRLSIDGVVADYPRTAQSGVGGYGFAGVTTYALGDVIATLDMAVTARADLTQGATVPDATLRIDRPGHDTIIMPVAGLIGCT